MSIVIKPYYCFTSLFHLFNGKIGKRSHVKSIYIDFKLQKNNSALFYGKYRTGFSSQVIFGIEREQIKLMNNKNFN